MRSSTKSWVGSILGTGLFFIFMLLVGHFTYKGQNRQNALMSPKYCLNLQVMKTRLYECEDVWKVNERYVALIRPTTIVSKNIQRRMVESVPEKKEWALVDLGRRAILPGKGSTNMAFTGLVEIKNHNGKNTISVYKPFSETIK